MKTTTIIHHTEVARLLTMALRREGVLARNQRVGTIRVELDKMCWTNLQVDFEPLPPKAKK